MKYSSMVGVIEFLNESSSWTFGAEFIKRDIAVKDGMFVMHLDLGVSS